MIDLFFRSIVAIALLSTMFVGCASHIDVQHFAVTDEQGNTNYYRVTVSGSSIGTEYRLQAGSFSSAAVEVLKGEMPEVAEIDLPLQHERVLDEIVSYYHQRILDDANLLVPDASARARWIATAAKLDDIRGELVEVEEKLARLQTVRDESARLRSRITTGQSAVAAAELSKEELTTAVAAATRDQQSRAAALSDATQRLNSMRKWASNQARLDKGELDGDDKKEEKKHVEAEQLQLATAIGTVPPPIVLQEDEVRRAEAAVQAARDHGTAKTKEQQEAVTRLIERRAELAQMEAELRRNRVELDRAEESARLLFQRKPKLWSRLQQALGDLSSLSSTTQPASQPVLTYAAATQPTTMEANPPAVLTTTQPTTRPSFVDVDGDNLPAILGLARLAWYASLSTEDIIAMGQERSVNPYVFRKHVVYVSARNIRLEEFGAEIDNAINGALAIARTAKQQAAQRRAQRDSKRQALAGAIADGKIDAAKLAEMFFPADADVSPGVGTFMKQLNTLRGRLLDARLTEEANP